MVRYLFGPVSASYAAEYLVTEREQGSCLTFHPWDRCDVRIRAHDTWKHIITRLPAGWRPDFVILFLGWNSVPACLWQAPVPIIGLAIDWQVHWHDYMRRLAVCDLILADGPGVEAFGQAHLNHVRFAQLHGCGASFVAESDLASDDHREIDVLFIGSLHPTEEWRRNQQLARLRPMADRWKLRIQTGTYGREYRKSLRTARVAFNTSCRNEANLRVFEAVACGALVAQEADNREVLRYLTPDRSILLYEQGDPAIQIERILEDEPRRRAMVSAACQALPRLTYKHLWAEALETIQSHWQLCLNRRDERCSGTRTLDLHGRVWQAVCGSSDFDSLLNDDLARALAKQPNDAQLANAAGVACMRTALFLRDPPNPAARKAAAMFRRALELDVSHVLAALNLVEVLATSRRIYELSVAEELVERALAGPGWNRREILYAPRAVSGVDMFRLEWERLGGVCADRWSEEQIEVKRLIRWRVALLVGKQLGDIPRLSSAVAIRPDLWPSQFALGRVLVACQRHVEAVPPLRTALFACPFHPMIAAALVAALQKAGNLTEAQEQVREWNRLTEVAPHLTRLGC